MKNIPGVSNSFNKMNKSIINNDLNKSITNNDGKSTDIEKVINSDGLVQSDTVDSTDNNPNDTNTTALKDQNPIIKTDAIKSHDKMKAKNKKNSDKSNCKDFLCSVFNY